ncbi:uncharacterized protein LOC131333765 [Rhododendron vialii]|uniref:uncharacterized protein LOC131333765 n=1 Tax=Rhododendron vialii TaxID=182163 RepID=UPI00265FC872|nr:uncharacterized protein LOC131333765 [Rhododendron vialii]
MLDSVGKMTKPFSARCILLILLIAASVSTIIIPEVEGAKGGGFFCCENLFRCGPARDDPNCLKNCIARHTGPSDRPFGFCELNKNCLCLWECDEGDAECRRSILSDQP